MAHGLGEVLEHLPSSREAFEPSLSAGVGQALRDSEVDARGAALSGHWFPHFVCPRPVAGLLAFLGPLLSATALCTRTHPTAGAS
jgi:hypothetical protein